MVIYFYTTILLLGITEAQLFGNFFPLNPWFLQSVNILPSWLPQSFNFLSIPETQPIQPVDFFTTVQPEHTQITNFLTSLESPLIQSSNALPNEEAEQIIEAVANNITVERIEDVPNPDLEPGIFPVPDPRSWPIGPDWNDPRNTWTRLDGWTGETRSNPLY